MEDAKGILQQLLKTVPKGFEHLFAGVTVWLTIEHVGKAKEGEKLSTAVADIAAMWPIIGGLMLMHEGATMEGGLPTKAGYLAGGGIVTVLGARQMAELIGKHGWTGGTVRAIASPAIMVYEAAGAIIRGPQYAAKMLQFGMRSGSALGVL
jgi:hypothetical protein